MSGVLVWHARPSPSDEWRLDEEDGEAGLGGLVDKSTSMWALQHGSLHGAGHLT